MRQRQRSVGVLVLVLALLAVGLAGCGSSAPKVDWTVKVSGAASQPLEVSYAELAKMPQTELKDVLMDKSLGEDVTGNWSGVAVQELLTKAGADANFKSVTATAADGYAIEISKEELQDAIIALKQEDKWITVADAEHGPIRLVCPHVPANRWVYQIQELVVNP
jgi:DMSO/TMAO reductase YedYZ molybdopterin-dependent catalytic subunit